MTLIGDIVSKSTLAKLYWINGYPGNNSNFIFGNNLSKFISSSLPFSIFFIFLDFLNILPDLELFILLLSLFPKLYILSWEIISLFFFLNCFWFEILLSSNLISLLKLIFLLNIFESSNILSLKSSSSLASSSITVSIFLLVFCWVSFPSSWKRKDFIESIIVLLIGLWVNLIILYNIISIGISLSGRLNKFFICSHNL